MKNNKQTSAKSGAQKAKSTSGGKCCSKSTQKSTKACGRSSHNED